MKLAILLFAATVLAEDVEPPKVEELVLGPAKQGNVYVLSPKGGHLAIVTQKGSRMVVIHDGVEGPKFDDIVNLDSNAKVVFSLDGARFAYLARTGDEYVLMVDGKELMRPGTAKGGYGNPVTQFAFTSNGKHFWFMQSVPRPIEKGGGLQPCVVWDGVAEIPGGVAPVISPDGEHHAYIATNPNDPKQQTVMLDGKPAGYSGTDPQFTGDSQHLFVRTWVPQGASGGMALQVLLDGKPWLKAQEATVHPAPVGDLVATVVRRTGNDGVTTCFLVVAGKKIEGSDCSAIHRVTFSPDGKRYAAECQTAAGAQLVLVDGKRGQEYSNISGVTFSPDSSRYHYLAMMNGKTFVVVDGEESDGYFSVQDFSFGGGGKRTGYIAQGDPTSKVVVIDGATANTNPQAFSELRFSEDGKHCAYLMVGAAGGMHLVLDGTENTELMLRPFQTWPGGKPASMVLSRDGKHVAAFAAPATSSQTPGLWIDGKLVQSCAHVIEPAFSPDGKHVYWTTFDGRAGKHQVHVDGIRCAQFGSGFLMPPGSQRWSVGEDGVLTVLAEDGDKMKRFRITPSPATSVETLLAASPKLDK